MAHRLRRHTPFLVRKACQSSWWSELVIDHITAGSGEQRVFSQELGPDLKAQPRPPAHFSLQKPHLPKVL